MCPENPRGRIPCFAIHLAHPIRTSLKSIPMKTIHRIIALTTLAGCLPAMAATVAYWRFEEGPNGAQVTHGGAGNGVFYAGALDSSGNGNDLSVFAEGWAGYQYATDLAGPTVPQNGLTNNFSVVNSGGYPAMSTATGSAMQTWTPSAWTIETTFQPETGGYRTLIGRDSIGANTHGADTNLAALYLQIIPGDALAIKYTDVQGYWHEAISAGGAITGYGWPNYAAGNWYAVAATSDGSTLSLYLKNIEGGATSYTLIAQTDLTASGSTNTALSAGAGDGGDWDAGNFTVGRGLYAGGHGDRAYGFIDETRISDTALSPSQFLWSPVPEPTSSLLGLSAMFLFLRRRR